MAGCFPSPHGWPKEGKTVYKGSLLLPRPTSLAPSFYGHATCYPSSSSSSEARTAAALRIHSQAEKRRRERINAHLCTLRRMVPDASKMDKASLLGRVIEQVRELKRKAIDISKGFTIPAEVNEVTVECDTSDERPTINEENLYIKASVCCEDRPDLFQDLIQAFHELRLRTIRADLTSLGGRVQNVFILCRKEKKENVCLSSLKDSIEEALGRVASTDLVSTTSLPSKRQRLLQSYRSNMSL